MKVIKYLAVVLLTATWISGAYGATLEITDVTCDKSFVYKGDL